MQGQAKCRFANRTAHVEGSKVAAAVAAYSAGQCKPLKLAHTQMSQCGCVLYETALLIAAQVRFLTSFCVPKCLMCVDANGMSSVCIPWEWIFARRCSMFLIIKTLHDTCRRERVSCDAHLKQPHRLFKYPTQKHQLRHAASRIQSTTTSGTLTSMDQSLTSYLFISESA